VVSSVERFSTIFITGGKNVPPRPPSFGLMAYSSQFNNDHIKIIDFFQLDLSFELDLVRGRPPRTPLGARR
jgi:hypothetical protein